MSLTFTQFELMAPELLLFATSKLTLVYELTLPLILCKLLWALFWFANPVIGLVCFLICTLVSVYLLGCIFNTAFTMPLTTLWNPIVLTSLFLYLILTKYVFSILFWGNAIDLTFFLDSSSFILLVSGQWQFYFITRAFSCSRV